MSTIDQQGNVHDRSGRFAGSANTRPSGSIEQPATEQPTGTLLLDVGEVLVERGRHASFFATNVNTGFGFRSGQCLRVRLRGNTYRVANFWTDNAGDTRVRVDTALGSETGMIDPDAVPMTNPTPEEVADAMLA